MILGRGHSVYSTNPARRFTVGRPADAAMGPLCKNDNFMMEMAELWAYNG